MAPAVEWHHRNQPTLSGTITKAPLVSEFGRLDSKKYERSRFGV